LITDFEKMFELGIVETPKRNLKVSNELRSGRRKAPPTLFVFVLRGNAGNSARKRALFFQKGGGSKSRAIQNNLSEKNFCCGNIFDILEMLKPLLLS